MIPLHKFDCHEFLRVRDGIFWKVGTDIQCKKQQAEENNDDLD